MGKIIDGKKLAAQVKRQIKEKVTKMAVKPGLAVVLVGNDPASKIYVRAKEKACQQVGFYSKQVVLPAEVEQEKLIKEIEKLNDDPKINGILVQLPLPGHLDEEKIIEAIDTKKDVDCFKDDNVGGISLIDRNVNIGSLLIPCTSKGIISLIKSTNLPLAGKRAVMVGRSKLVGKPTALLLLAENMTVTICHSQTKDLEKETLQADVLVVAVGRPKMITAKMVKKGAIIIDVGINRTKSGLVGDVDFINVKKKAAFVTPVPGGVGPMTIAALMENTLLLTERAA